MVVVFPPTIAVVVAIAVVILVIYLPTPLPLSYLYKQAINPFVHLHRVRPLVRPRGMTDDYTMFWSGPVRGVGPSLLTLQPLSTPSM